MDTWSGLKIMWLTSPLLMEQSLWIPSQDLFRQLEQELMSVLISQLLRELPNLNLWNSHFLLICLAMMAVLCVSSMTQLQLHLAILLQLLVDLLLMWINGVTQQENVLEGQSFDSVSETQRMLDMLLLLFLQLWIFRLTIQSVEIELKLTRSFKFTSRQLHFFRGIWLRLRLTKTQPSM